MKRKLFLCIAIIMVLACGCSEDKNIYVDPNKAKDNLTPVELNITSNDFSMDEKPFNIMMLNSTIGSDYLYVVSSLGNYHVDLQSGVVKGFCNITGCAHDPNSSVGCLNYFSFSSIIAADDGFYYIDSNTVRFHSDKDDIIVYENTYSTDFEEEYYPDNPNVLGALASDDDILYIIGPTYYLTYDTESKKFSDTQIISDVTIHSLCVEGDNIYYTNENDELYAFDTTKKESKKLSDKVNQVCINNGNLYYIQYENGTPFLFSMDLSSHKSTKLIENCYVNYCINGSNIYYQNRSEPYKIFVCGIDGSDPREITVDFVEYDENGDPIPYNTQRYFIFATSSNIDHVFIIDDERGVVFALKSGDTEYKTINANGVIYN